jgi:pimeloyl-ACP methyl ester carboxylesterase
MARMVLVHGAFSGAWNWEPVLPGLRAAGHEVETLDLPGQGDDTTPVSDVSLDRYASRVCEQLKQGPPAVLVGHSMGGMVVTQAAARLPQQITALIYMAAFIPNDGESLLDLTRYPEAAGDMIQANLVVTGEPPVATLPDATAREAIYHCCTDEQAAWAVARRGPQPAAPMGEPFRLEPDTAAAFEALPRRYVATLQDRCLRLPMQRLLLERAGCEPVIELDTDHAPQLSRTVELVSALDELASLP